MKHLALSSFMPHPCPLPSWPVSVATECFHFLLWVHNSRKVPSATLNPCSLLAPLSKQEMDKGFSRFISWLEQELANTNGGSFGLAR